MLSMLFNWFYGCILAKRSKCFDGFVVHPHLVSLAVQPENSVNSGRRSSLSVAEKHLPPETSRPLWRIQKNSTPAIAYLLLFRRSRHRFSELPLQSRLSVLQLSSTAPHLPWSCFIPHISSLISKGSYFYFNGWIVSPMCQRQSGRSSSLNSG